MKTYGGFDITGLLRYERNPSQTDPFNGQELSYEDCLDIIQVDHKFLTSRALNKLTFQEQAEEIRKFHEIHGNDMHGKSKSLRKRNVANHGKELSKWGHDGY